jgi:hypothetical protein
VKLFPSVARKVLARASGSPLHADTSKLVLPLAATQAHDDSVPLRALYVLPDPTHGARRQPERVSIAPIEGQKAFLEIIRSAFNLIQVDRPRLANQFNVATRLVRDVPIRRLTYRRKLTLLDMVCDAVIADVATLRRPQSGIIREAARRRALNRRPIRTT